MKTGRGDSAARLLVAATLCLPALACFACSEAAERYRMTETASGIPWARNVGPGAWGADRRWTVEVGLRLGETEGSGPSMFGRIRGLAVGRMDELFVLDDMAQEIRVFNAEGSHLRSFGRTGPGPGEFSYADGIVLHGDSLWVYDARRGSLSLFDGTGTFLRSVRVRSEGSVIPPPTTVLDDGTLAGWRYINPGRDYNVPLLTGNGLSLYQPVQVDPGTGLMETFPSIEVRAPTVNRIRVPLTGSVEVVLDPDGSIWFSHPTDYTIYHRTPTGDTVMILSLEDADLVEIQASERDSIADVLRTQASRMHYRGALPTASDVPRHRAAIERLLVSDSGFLFVNPRLKGVKAGSVLDVFDTRNGEYQGRITLPFALDRQSPAVVTSDYLVMGSHGDLDVPILLRLDFVKGRR